MKKLTFNLIAVFAIIAANAQVTIDTVSTGPDYTNQKWYSLEDDEQGSSAKNNWDIAFDASDFGTSVHINSITGTTLWTYPKGDTSAWTTIDTMGINTWTKKYNSDTSWGIGAFDQGKETGNPYDIGWGIYNVITHVVTGDSLFIIQLSNGTYKKLRIKNLLGGAYNFSYANLDGSDLQNTSLLKSNFSKKNFAYYSLQTNTELNREPVENTDWDLFFGQYTAFIPIPYGVAGVLSNNGVTVAQANGINDVNSYTDWVSHTFTTEINEIGYDWKSFTGAWNIEDSLIYFVKSRSGDIWKLIFLDFGGGANGNYIFSKEKLHSAGIKDIKNNISTSFSIYPNPAYNGNTNIAYHFENYKPESVFLNIYDLSGRNVHSEPLSNNTGLNTHNVNALDLTPGIYIVSIEINQQRIQKKLIIK